MHPTDGLRPVALRSNYKNDTMIRKECYVGQAVLDEMKRIIEESEVRLGAGRGGPGRACWRRVGGLWGKGISSSVCPSNYGACPVLPFCMHPHPPLVSLS